MSPFSTNEDKDQTKGFDIGVSPYKMILDLPFLRTLENAGTYEGEWGMRKYKKTITCTLEELNKEYLPQTAPIDFKIHKLQPGDWVLIRT